MALRISGITICDEVPSQESCAGNAKRPWYRENNMLSHAIKINTYIRIRLTFVESLLRSTNRENIWYPDTLHAVDYGNGPSLMMRSSDHPGPVKIVLLPELHYADSSNSLVP